MDIALSYLRALARRGYFAEQHTACDDVWIEGHPACGDGPTWERAKDFLVEHGYLVIGRPPPAELARIADPRDQHDAWWFELTPKGAQAIR